MWVCVIFTVFAYLYILGRGGVGENSALEFKPSGDSTSF